MPSKDQKHKPHKRRNFHGPQIRRIREQHRYTLVDMQAILEEYGYFLNSTNIGRIERGERALSDVELHVFALALDVAVAELIAEPVFANKEDLINALKSVQRRGPGKKPKKKR